MCYNGVVMKKERNKLNFLERGDKVAITCSVDALISDFNMPETAAKVLISKPAKLLGFENDGGHAVVMFMAGFGQVYNYLLPVSVLRKA